MMAMMTPLSKIYNDMKTIKFNPGTSLESCYKKLQEESFRCGDVVCGDFNDTLMRSDEPLRLFYQKYYNTFRNDNDLKEQPSELIRQFANQYAQSIPQDEHNRIYSEDDFIAGMGFWAEIRRDKDGFATEDCLNEMFANMPFLIYDRSDNDIEAVCCDDWRGDIDKHSYYTHWKPIPLPKMTPTKKL